MKRNFAIVGIVVMFVAGALALSSRSARAQSNAAVIINDQLCGVFAGDCSTVEISTDNHEVQTSLATSGNAMLSCKLDLPAGAPLPANGAAHCDTTNTGGGLCNTSYGSTADWSETISASRQVTLRCHVNGQP